MPTNGPKSRISFPTWSAKAIVDLSAAVATHSSSETDLLRTAAAAIIRAHADSLPDLSACQVLLPNLHAAAGMARALADAAHRPTLLLPQISTLPQLAANLPLPHIPVSTRSRQSLLYAALRSRNWVDPVTLWGLTADLLRLFDELNAEHVRLPENYADFLAQLAAAYKAAAGASLQFEARLVYELWHALQQDLHGRLDASGAYLLRLSAWAEQADRPLYVVGVDTLSTAEKNFLLAYARRQPVQIFQSNVLSEADLSPRGRLLNAAWTAPDSDTPTAPTLLERASALRASLPSSPYSGALRYFGAHSLEQEAQAAAQQIQTWLNRGLQNIAIVAQDRRSARRLRALLERQAILVEDETGWTFSTTAASALLMRWLDLLGEDFYYQHVLDFLKSPWVFSGSDREQRRLAVAELELLIREHNVVSGLSHYLALAQAKNKSECSETLRRLQHSAQAWALRRALPLADWIALLLTTLDDLEISQAFAKDLAGAQLLDNLQLAAMELEGAFERYHFSEFRQWLNQQFETATFLDSGISSSIVFTHLAATRLRVFDAALILGCDAAHLPSPTAHSGFFNQAVRADLQLPTAQDTLRQEQRDLAGLLLRSEEILITWQAYQQGEANALSPWLDLLDACHQLAYGEHLVAADVGTALAVTIPPVSSTPRGRPAPLLQVPPASISASGYASLMACPYQYFARHALALNALDEVQLEMEKRDFGTLVHKILQRFHARYPRLPQDPQGLAQAAQSLEEISAAAFAPLLRLNYLSHAWRWQWQALQGAYLKWQAAHEAQGWRFQAGEQAADVMFELGEGLQLRLHGRIDRIDQTPDALAVIDYKLRDKNALAEQLATPGEDVQLPVYALLAGNSVSKAAYLSFHKGQVQLVPTEDVQTLAEQVGQRLQSIFQSLHAGAGLPAQGTPSVCTYCEMEGLCRRSYWTKRSVNG